MSIVGLDIGGANLKASDGERRSVSQTFPLWKQPDLLTEALSKLLEEFDRPQHVVVTMTGELADCFETKAEGVDRILTSVESATTRPVHVWQQPGEFVTPTVAREFPRLVAAANWHALATWAGRMTPVNTNNALLIDIGSTTTDIIPLSDRLPNTIGNSDFERLAAGELVYTGLRRTPVCAVTSSVDVAGERIPLAAEFFATMHDVHLLLGSVAEEEANVDTADARPATIPFARHRLARMLCCDITELTQQQLSDMAAQIATAQIDQLVRSLNAVVSRMTKPAATVLLSGEGETIGQRMVSTSLLADTAEVLSLRDAIGEAHSQAACAFALARLATERLP